MMVTCDGGMTKEHPEWVDPALRSLPSDTSDGDARDAGVKGIGRTKRVRGRGGYRVGSARLGSFTGSS